MKKLLLFALALCTTVAGYARQYTPDEAEAIAANLRGDLQTRGMLKSANKQRAQLTRINGASSTLAYVFNYTGNDGFVIVAGDDRAGSVLAYSPTGAFNPDNLSPAAQSWLNSAKTFVTAAAEGRAVRATATADVYDTAVEPLCTSKWGQDEPYSDLCPMMTNSKGEKERAATGCAATALAQILYYYKAPAAGIGTNSVTTADGETITVDFTQSNYDWTSMTDTYDSNSSEASQAAVAKLMLDCGVAMDMIYGATSDGGSGAESEDMLNGIINVFGMSKNMRHQQKDYFRDHEEWCNLLKAELDAKRPVLYCGYTPFGEGHAFVCDGYDRSGLFHINWGWDGNGNGYYDIHYLDPGTQGTGGAASGDAFCYGQEAFLGLQPTTDESAAIISYTLYADSIGFALPEDATEEDTHVVLTVNGLTNHGYDEFTGKVYLGVFDSEGNCVANGELTDLPESIAAYDSTFTTSVLVDLATLDEGEYSLAAYSTDASGYSEEVRTLRYGYPVAFALSGTGIDVKNSYDIDFNILDVASTTDAETGTRSITAKFTVTNNDDYEVFMLPLSVAALTDNEEELEDITEDQMVKGEAHTLYLAPGTTTDMLTTTVSGIDYDKNACYLVFLDMTTQEGLGYVKVDFTTTGIASLTGDKSGKTATLTTSDGHINVNGLTAGERVTISDLSGRTLYTGRAADATLRVAVPTHGLYVVKTGQKGRKIVVK